MLRCCRIENNEAEDGAGIAVLQFGAAHVLRCTVKGNSATGTGGGVYVQDGGYLLVEESLFWGNSATQAGGALQLESSTRLSQCTIVGNSSTNGPGAINVHDPWDGQIELDHCIITACSSASRRAPVGGCAAGYGVVTATCTDIYGNTPSGFNWAECLAGQGGQEGNLEADPKFCDANNGDFRLDAESPCLDHETCGQIGAFGACASLKLRVSAEETRLMTVGRNPAARPRLLFSVATEHAEAIIELSIFDASGRRVRQLFRGASRGGDPQVVEWDRANDGGVPVPAGVYFAVLRVESGGGAVRKLVLLQ